MISALLAASSLLLAADPDDNSPIDVDRYFTQRADHPEETTLDRSGLFVAANVGMAFPFGPFTDNEGTPLAFIYVFNFPLELDVGWRLPSGARFGGYFDNTQVIDNCINCGGTVFRFGAEAAMHGLRSPTFDPWVGVTAGWEVDTLEGPAGFGTGYFHGPDLSARFGLEWVVTPVLRAGFMLAGSLGMFLFDNSPGDPFLVSKPSIHGWFSTSIRLTFGPLVR